ncbi:MAG TPA: hypothetical protein VHU84_06970, partial [Lacipirellulaceae bacterium]|nr:hypothetical protein [Lacipirellulaceae bacterium]
GHLFNAAFTSRDLEFQFLLQEGTEALTGVVVYQIPGDFNSDGAVDAADYVVWRSGLGTSYTACDYQLWRDHFGEAAAAGSAIGSSTSVPEPSLFGLFLTALCMLGAHSRDLALAIDYSRRYRKRRARKSPRTANNARARLLI